MTALLHLVTCSKRIRPVSWLPAFSHSDMDLEEKLITPPGVRPLALHGNIWRAEIVNGTRRHREEDVDVEFSTPHLLFEWSDSHIYVGPGLRVLVTDLFIRTLDPLP